MHRAGNLTTRRRYWPLVNLTLARLREFVRQPHAVFWTYVFPLILVSALGIAFRNRPLDAVRIVLVRSPQAEPVYARLQNNPQFQTTLCDEHEARRRFRTTRADLLLAVSAEAPNRYEYTFDPSRTESVLARRSVDDFLEHAAGRQNVTEAHDQQLDEPGGHYADFLVPGLVGMGLMSGGLMGVGYALVDMRIRKLLKHYFATPVKHSHFLAAVMISRFLFTVTQVFLLLVFARVIFGVSSQGSYLALLPVIVLGALEFSGVGLLIGSRAQTMEMLSGLMNAIMLPMWIGCGIFFSTDRFPEAVQSAVVLLPLTPLVHALRSIMLDGTSLFALGGDLALIALWGCATFVLALRWFRWK